MHILSVLIIVLEELKVDLLGKEIFQKEVHQLSVFLLLEIVITEHHHTPAYYQLTTALLMLIHSADRPVAGISQGSRCQDSIAGIVHIQRSSVHVNEIDSCTFRLLLIFLLLFISVAHHEGIVVPTFWLFGIPVDHSGHFLVEDAVMDVCFFRVEVFVKRSSDNAV